MWRYCKKVSYKEDKITQKQIKDQMKRQNTSKLQALVELWIVRRTGKINRTRRTRTAAHNQPNSQITIATTPSSSWSTRTTTEAVLIGAGIDRAPEGQSNHKFTSRLRQSMRGSFYGSPTRNQTTAEPLEAQMSVLMVISRPTLTRQATCQSTTRSIRRAS